mgnify:CR=1 FL=1
MSTAVVAFSLVDPLVVALSLYGFLLVVHVPVVVSIVVFPTVVALVPIVRTLSEWCRHVPTLSLSTLLVELVDVSGMAVREAVFVPQIGFPTLVAEITPIANEQKSSSLVSRFEHHSVALSKLLPTVMASRKFHLHMGQ